MQVKALLAVTLMRTNVFDWPPFDGIFGDFLGLTRN